MTQLVGGPVPVADTRDTVAARGHRCQHRAVAPGRGVALLETYRAFMRAHHDALVTVYPGVLDLLPAIRAHGILTGLVTAKARAAAAPAFATFLLDRELSVIVTEDGTDRHKPHPAPRCRVAPQRGTFGVLVRRRQHARSPCRPCRRDGRYRRRVGAKRPRHPHPPCGRRRRHAGGCPRAPARCPLRATRCPSRPAG